jgi:hypothetical protein
MSENRRRIHTLFGEVEYLPAPTRRVSSLHVEAEVLPGPHRRVSSLMVEVEYIPSEIQIQSELSVRYNWIRNTLQADPGADVTSLVNDYRAALEAAYGITFSGSPDWGLVGIHFARLGLDAVAWAIKSWCDNEINRQHLSYGTDRFSLFRRVFPPVSLINSSEVKTNIAESSLGSITIFQRPNLISYYRVLVEGIEVRYATVDPDGNPKSPPAGELLGTIDGLPQYAERYGEGPLIGSGRQGIMTPNNFIHELGHSLSRFAGFGTSGYGTNPGRGSIEYAVYAAGSPYTNFSRAGMGELFLQEFVKAQLNEGVSVADLKIYYEHARIINNNPTAGFDTSVFNRPPTITAPDQRDDYYLLYSLLGESHFALWNEDDYNPYGLNARIDFHVHNAEASALETAADFFLNWVRNKLQKLDTTDPDWSIFARANIGIFLRNAVLYHHGSVDHYQRLGAVGGPVAMGTVQDPSYRLRLTDDNPAQNIERNVLNDTAQASDFLPSTPLSVEIYGYVVPTNPIDQYSDRWLLVKDIRNRLVWIASAGLSGYDLSQVDPIPQPDVFYLNYEFKDADILTILGA